MATTIHDTEKYSHGNHVDHNGDVAKTFGSDTNSGDGYMDEEYTPAEQRAIIHRIDRRLVTTCGFMYCISLMDRTNLSAAAIVG